MSYEGTPEDVLRERILEEEDRLAAKRSEELSGRRAYRDARVDVPNFRTEMLDSIGVMIPEVLSRIAAHNYPDGELAYVPDENGTLSERAIWQVASMWVSGGGMPFNIPKEPDSMSGPSSPRTEHIVFLASDGGIYHRMEKSQAGQPKSDYRRIPINSIEDIDRWCGNQKKDIRGRSGLLRFLLGTGPVLGAEFVPHETDESLWIGSDSLMNALESGLKRMKRKYAVIKKNT